ncbi:MAG: NTP transferase domain-containing protein [Candidatus Woesearchaeota archaeon]|nr:MAG: NTP transferase domain-containing protein [Candidatus Woesearchaeota archaeon]
MVKVVFLCGGIGKRMHPITTDKFLLNFLGKTLLENQIELAQKAGFNDFVMVSNKRSIETIKGICKNVDANIEFAIQKEAKGMADALISARELLIDDEIIIVKPNDVVNISAYKNILKEAKNKDYDSYVLGYVVDEYFPGGYLSVDKNDEINGVVEKPGKGNEPSNIVNLVIHLHRKTKDLFKYMENTERDRDDIYEYSMDKMMKDGFKFKAVRYTGFWVAIQYPWHIFKVMNHFLDSIEQKISPTAKIHKTAIIEGNVIIDDNVRIFENAVVKGPTYIGKNCIIGNNALVRSSNIAANCVVGFSTEVKSSYICENCWLHMNYIGDSIIDSRCSFGSGSITANLRFDEENVKVNVEGQKINSGTNKLGVIMGKDCGIGINANIMPGIKVGPNSIIGAGVTLMEDLKPNKIALLVDNSYCIKDNKCTPDIKKREEMRKKLK